MLLHMSELPRVMLNHRIGGENLYIFSTRLPRTKNLSGAVVLPLPEREVTGSEDTPGNLPRRRSLAKH